MKTLPAFRIRAMALALVCVAAIGCSSQPAPEKHHYLLGAPDATVEVQQVSQVHPGKLRIPAYLRSTQIAVAISATEIQPAKFHLWAEPPQEAIERLFRSRLASAPPNARQTDLPRVDIDIVQLLGNLEGEVRLRAVYSFHRGAQALGPSRFFDERIDQRSDGYPGLVEAHNALLESLALEVVKHTPQPTPGDAKP